MLQELQPQGQQRGRVGYLPRALPIHQMLRQFRLPSLPGRWSRRVDRSHTRRWADSHLLEE